MRGRTELDAARNAGASSLVRFRRPSRWVGRSIRWNSERSNMAWSNFMITAAVIGGLFYMTKSDVRQGASMFRRNVKTIKSWMEQGEQR